MTDLIEFLTARLDEEEREEGGRRRADPVTGQVPTRPVVVPLDNPLTCGEHMKHSTTPMPGPHSGRAFAVPGG